ncbi:uncharacterized protein LOC105229187 [Bactrocera dorsalis]|uniref:Uncharacterized protein LOC105229187 n=1 Tax=Bactrocera dorsalis TaxID=27457 RepID=A0ABM3JJI5_BACDO|nr:uncharacterized protein LOC105229187 [Bactrocera dorsalis]XP_049309383.1 uncharacterized protein LOC105229187 [Bactrocera dorsalis]
MPICNKPAQATKNVAEFDDYASEAAKMKRTREQAYFNSYNFDAIHPYDKDNEAIEEMGVHKVVGVSAAAVATHASAITATKVPPVVGGSNSHNQQQQQLQKPHNTLKTIYRGASSIASSTPSTRSSFQHSSSSGRSSGCGSQHSPRSSIADDVDNTDAVGYKRRPQPAGELTYTYMQRFGVRLVRSRNASPSADVERTSPEGGSGGGAIAPTEELASVHAKKGSANEVSENGSFLLPRAMLKYQSVGNANSMPLAVNSSGRADKLLQNGHNHQQLSGNNESGYNNNNSNSNNNNSASYNKYNKNNNSSSSKTIMMTTNAISNKHSNNNNNNNSNNHSNSSNSLSSNKSNATTNIANTKPINNSNSKSNNNTTTTNSHIATKNGLNYANSNDGYASLLVASDVTSTAPFRVVTAAKTPTAATAKAKPTTAVPKATATAPGAAVRVKKQSTSSTITTTTTSSSVSAAEHNETTTPATTATAAVATPTRGNGNGKVSQTSKSGDTKSAQSGSVERRGRTSSHQSHYSTDKSGSSGYYSSNVCSTYSLDEHIYCEPVIDILDVSRTGAGANGGAGKASKSARSECTNTKGNANSGDNSKSNQTTNEMSSKGGGATKRCYGRRNATAVASRNGESGIAGCSELDGGDDCDGDAEDESAAAVVARRGNNKAGRKSQAVAETAFGVDKIPASLQFLLQRQTSDEYANSQHFSENLRILETSIENLDRHLKNFPSLSSHEHIAAFVQAHHHHHHHHLAYLQTPSSVETGDKLVTRVPPHVTQHQLPTIMEGYDPANQPRRSWPDDMVDDSLLDIDLDSFLLVNERKAGGIGKSARKSSLHAVGGIDNPTFLTEEQEEENNYKCAKYINSCPDDAYHVESDIVAGTGTVSEKSVSVGDHYMKRYEDQLHFQSTRELLEDVRDKIRLLSQASGNTSRSGSAKTHSPDMSLSVTTPTEQLPRELEGMIKTLKTELENYLDRMNQHSELEIRQLCSGLVRNHNIVKMTKAFERRRSTHSLGTIESDYGYVGGNYEAIRDGVPSSIREQIVSIRCASDPNFKMKRKSLTEVFPVADCYAESEKLQTPTTQIAQQQLRPSLPRRDRVEQRQREHDQNVITLHVPTTQLQRNLSFQQPVLNKLDAKSLQAPPTDAEISGKGGNPNGAGAANGNGSGGESGESGDKDSILEWHRKKPSIWEMYYGTNRMNQSLLGKRNGMVTNNNNQVPMSYPSSRPESDFTLDLPRAEQLRIKMEKEKKFRQRCRYITTFLSLVFFLLTVMVVSLVLTRGKRMFGSMI